MEQELPSLLLSYELRGKQPFVSDFSRLLQHAIEKGRSLFYTVKNPETLRGSEREKVCLNQRSSQHQTRVLLTKIAGQLVVSLTKINCNTPPLTDNCALELCIRIHQPFFRMFSSHSPDFFKHLNGTQLLIGLTIWFSQSEVVLHSNLQMWQKTKNVLEKCW